MVKKTLHSAASNLENKLGRKVGFENIYIKEAYADKGPMKNLRRYHAGPQGRAMPYVKNSCHLTIVVTDEKGGK